jgi:Flp pilus assembly secretin CpaC
MAALCARGRATLSPLHVLSGVLISIALAAPAAAAPPPPAPEPVVVFVDQARILQLPDRAATVVVGNPLIADLSIQPGGLAVVTGKSYGATNFIVLDHNGAVLTEKTVEVEGPIDPTVVVYRAQSRQTYSCMPDCEPRITLGDTGKEDFDKETQLYSDYFARTINQAATRNGQATAAGSLNSGH